ncbi:MAG: DUF1127 domain-containing protein [Acidiferrobacterales bacterium]
MTANSLEQLFSRVQQWNRRRATIRTLRSLSDWQLKDIGLTRGQIPAAVDAALNGTTRAHTASVPAANDRIGVASGGGAVPA